MRNYRSFQVIGMILLLGSVSSIAWAEKAPHKRPGIIIPEDVLATGQKYVSNEVVVKFKSDIRFMDREAFQSQVHASSTIRTKEQAVQAFHQHFKSRSRRTTLGWETVVLPKEMTVSEAMEVFAKNPLVEKVELNAIVHAAAASASNTYTPFLIPNDPIYQNVPLQQWWASRTKADRAYQAFTDGTLIFSGSSNIIVAVLDTGLNASHPDFVGRTITGISTADYTTSTNDDNIYNSGGQTLNGHGTHVAGMIIANTNNGAGIMGTAFRSEVKVMPVKVLDSLANGTATDVADGIVWAADNGADIINLSVESDASITAWQDACDYAANTKHCLLIAAAGNAGRNIGPVSVPTPYTPVYPACYSSVNAVTAVNAQDWDTVYGNASSGGVIKCSAPGGQLQDNGFYYGDNGVTGTARSGGYSTLEGTSFAAPQVSALAAMLKLQLPSRTNTEIINIILSTCENTNGIDPYYIGAGRINVYSALSVYKTATPIPPTATITLTSTISPTPTISATVSVSPTPTMTGTITPTPTITPTWHGIKDLNSDALIVFPNPAKKNVTFAFVSSAPGGSEFFIYNSAYQLVAHFTRSVPQSGPRLEPWSVSDIAPGVYLCRMVLATNDGKKKNFPVTKLVVLK